MESTSFKIEKLRDSDNWLQWRFVIRTLLEEDEDILAVCEGEFERPAENSANYEVKLQKFLKADKTARRLIVTSIEKKPLDLLLSCTTARQMWKKLNAVYDMRSDENLSIVQKQFFDFKWDSDESVSHNLAKVEQLATKMKNLGGAVPESMILTRILSILPKKFNHFHSAWDSVEDKKRTLENLTARLMCEEVRAQEQESSEDMAVALLMKRRSTNTSFPKNNYQHKQNHDERQKKTFTGCYTCGRTDHIRKDCVGCHVCGSKGHLSRNCFKKNGNFRRRNSGSANNMQQTSSSTQKQAFVGSSKGLNDDNVWLIDSGATDHMTYRRDIFTKFEKFEEPITIRLGNGELTPAYGKGNVEIETYVDGKCILGTMYDVLFVPKLSQNLFSIITVTRKGIDHAITEYGKKCVFSRDGIVIATGSIWGDLFKVNLRVVKPKICNVAENVKSLQLWHERLCHQNFRHVKCFLKDKGIQVIDDSVICEGCAYGKQHKSSFHNRSDRATKCREIIHTDVCGPMEHESIGRKRYFLIFKDDYSGFRQIFFMKQKSEVAEKLQIFCNQVENLFGENIKELHSDCGKEFKNRDVECFLGSKGIKHTVSVPYTPQQNGVAERENRIIVEAARSMLYSKSELPLSLWAEATNTAAFVINRTGPSKQPGQTPYELWYGKQANVDNFKIFGTECFVHVPYEKRKKLDRKAVKGYLVGYIENCKGYRVYAPSLRDVVLSRDVLFKPERLVPNNINVDTPQKGDEIEENVVAINDLAETNPEVVNNIEESLQISNDNSNGIQLRDRRTIKRTNFYGCPISFHAEKLPSDYNEAINCSEKVFWMDAMKEEMNALRENETWLLVDKPENRKVINNRWVYTKKSNPDSTERFRARLVIKGCSQIPGVDYKETFSPVARYDTVRFLLSIAANNSLCLGQFDIKTAFLYGNLDDDIYMKQPEGFHDGTAKVCKLLKSLYGLKQAPRCWTEHFSEFIKKFGFSKSSADSCFYIYEKNNEKMFLVIYVDDGLIAASHEQLIDKFFAELRKNFKITCTKEVGNFLGIEICRLKDGSIFINQGKYIENIVERFNLSDANYASTPIEVGWDANDFIKDNCSNIPYREAVGSLMFVQLVSRPDISFAVNIASRVLDKPTKAHWLLVKRIIRFLKGTADLGLFYKKNDNFATYSDADFGGDKETRKSTSGMVCMFANAPIVWQSKRQQCVSLSTTEAEYVSAASAAKEIVWIQKLFRDCKIDVNCMLYVDNMSALKLVKNPEFHQRSKHIDIKYHFVRDLYERGEINVKYVKSEDQIADIFTKAIAKPRYIYLSKKLGLISKSEII